MAKNNQHPDEEMKNTTVQTTSTWRRMLRNFLWFAVVVAVCAVFGWWQLDQHIKRRSSQQPIDLSKTCEEKLQTTATRLEALEKELNYLKMQQNNISAGISDADINAKFSAFEKKITAQMQTALQQIVEQQIQPTVPSNIKLQQELLLASGTMIVRDLAERGLPFAYETEVLQIMAAGNEQAMKYVDMLQQYASSGIKGKKMLLQEFNHIYSHLSDDKMIEAQKEEVKNSSTAKLPWWKNAGLSLLRWSKNLFAGKKTPNLPVLQPENDKVFELVNEGDLAAALNELNTNTDYAQLMNEPLRQWTLQVQMYLNFEKAISGLLMNSLANLHLKEMDH